MKKKFDFKNKKVFVAGHNGLIGRDICDQLEKYEKCIIIKKSRRELDLFDPVKTNNFIKKNKPDLIIIAAAKVGGIKANYTYPADFILENLSIQTNIINSSLKNKIQRLIFLGSSCIYPKINKIPISEDRLLTDQLEKTNEYYAIAKISGIKLCEAIYKQYGFKYLSVMPTNLYGINDNFNKETSHVIPGLISKLHDAKINNKKTVKLWGTGKAKRDFLNSKDCARAIIHIAKYYNTNEIINIGSGNEINIKNLSLLIKKIVGFNGKIIFDKKHPDGTLRKMLDISKLRSLNWVPQIKLEEGIKEVYENFKINN